MPRTSPGSTPPDRAGRSGRRRRRDTPAGVDAEPGGPASELAALTVAQLRDRARTDGRSGYSRLTKAQLIDLLS
ncbi:hypothetical protein MhomT_09375 [Microbacterium hominis]|nr:hypothetical protein MhomT_09375 [Microbacterium hominis]